MKRGIVFYMRRANAQVTQAKKAVERGDCSTGKSAIKKALKFHIQADKKLKPYTPLAVSRRLDEALDRIDMVERRVLTMCRK